MSAALRKTIAAGLAALVLAGPLALSSAPASAGWRHYRYYDDGYPPWPGYAWRPADTYAYGAPSLPEGIFGGLRPMAVAGPYCYGTCPGNETYSYRPYHGGLWGW
ncbi:MAG: hypothetical protein ACHQAY_06345 [Hyphomicrobiales bacterium]